jgi:hypothetical protein
MPNFVYSTTIKSGGEGRVYLCFSSEEQQKSQDKAGGVDHDFDSDSDSLEAGIK